MTDQGPGFTADELFEMGDHVADAYLAGLIPGTLRFSRALLGHGYRKVAAQIPELIPEMRLPNVVHYFVIGASEHHPNMLGWQCSCTKYGDRSFAEPAGAFADALTHVPAGDAWHAKSQRG